MVALKDADGMIGDILAAADIDRDGKISFDGGWILNVLVVEV